MSWASRMRFVYTAGVLLFFGVVFGIPFAIWWYEPPTCFDKKMNQAETAIDKGGPCILLDERTLSPYSVLWSRAFPVRDESYNVAAYVENPNADAAVRAIRYVFRLYDERNVVVAERTGSTFLMPGGITPIFEGAISTGNRVVSRTYFEFIENPRWERLADPATSVMVNNTAVSNPESAPRITARVQNTSVVAMLNPVFIAVVFDPAGNAFAASQTTLPRLDAGQGGDVVFSWLEPFPSIVGRIDIIPVVPPSEQ